MPYQSTQMTVSCEFAYHLMSLCCRWFDVLETLLTFEEIHSRKLRAMDGFTRDDKLKTNMRYQQWHIRADKMASRQIEISDNFSNK